MGEFVNEISKQVNSTVGIDFDGVIHKNSKGFHDGTIYDEPVKGAKKALELLSKKFNIVIYTCKGNSKRPLINNKTGTQLIWEWLKKYNLNSYISEITDKKPRALFYIDDKAITFTTWKDVLDIIKNCY